jgi:hypothetical protein
MAAIRSTALPFWLDDLKLARKQGWAAKAAHLVILVALGLGALTDGASTQTFEPRIEEPEEFPDFPGREDTFYSCSACHHFALVARQNMSRERWDGILDLMTERHGMAEVKGKDRAAVLDYLEKAFPQSDAPRGWQNPFLNR